MRNIYFSYVHSVLLYGIELYANTYTSHFDKLCQLNNILLRILQFKQLDFPVVKLHENFNTLPLVKLYKQQILFVRKFINHRHKLSPVFNN